MYRQLWANRLWASAGKPRLKINLWNVFVLTRDWAWYKKLEKKVWANRLWAECWESLIFEMCLFQFMSGLDKKCWATSTRLILSDSNNEIEILIYSSAIASHAQYSYWGQEDDVLHILTMSKNMELTFMDFDLTIFGGTVDEWSLIGFLIDYVKKNL